MRVGCQPSANRSFVGTFCVLCSVFPTFCEWIPREDVVVATPSSAKVSESAARLARSATASRASRFRAPSVATPIARRSASDARARPSKVTRHRTSASANAGGAPSTACAHAATSCHSPRASAFLSSASASAPPTECPYVAPSRHALTCATRASGVSATSARRSAHTGHTGCASGGAFEVSKFDEAASYCLTDSSRDSRAGRASSSSSWYSSATDRGTASSSSSRSASSSPPEGSSPLPSPVTGSAAAPRPSARGRFWPTPPNEGTQPDAWTRAVAGPAPKLVRSASGASAGAPPSRSASMPRPAPARRRTPERARRSDARWPVRADFKSGSPEPTRRDGVQSSDSIRARLNKGNSVNTRVLFTVFSHSVPLVHRSSSSSWSSSAFPLAMTPRNVHW